MVDAPVSETERVPSAIDLSQGCDKGALGIWLAFNIETAALSKAAEHRRTPRSAGHYALISRRAFWSAAVLHRFPMRQTTPDTKRFTFVRMTTLGVPPDLPR